jgi:hypothetical protein
MFCAPGLVFGGTECVSSHFYVLRARTHFQRYRGRRVPFSCFALPDSFSAVPRASGLLFIFCAPELIFGGTEGVGSRFHVLRPRTNFRRYRGRQVPFLCFTLPDSFFAVPSALVPIFMFCVAGLIFGGTEGVGSRFHVLCSRTHFRPYRVRRVPFSFFAHPDSFSTVPRASVPVFMFCAPEIIFGGTECVGSRFHVLRARTHFRRYRGRWVPFSCFAPLTLFRPYRGRRVPFSCFALRDSFSAVPRASGYFFMFCTPGLVFRDAECIGSCFLVLCARTCFRRYRGRRVWFSCFDRPDSFSAVPKAPGPIFMYCAPGLVFCGAESVGFRFHV